MPGIDLHKQEKKMKINKIRLYLSIKIVAGITHDGQDPGDGVLGADDEEGRDVRGADALGLVSNPGVRSLQSRYYVPHGYVHQQRLVPVLHH